MEGITEPMRQYWKSTEQIYLNKPKNGKPYGIKRPESATIVAVLGGICALLIIIGDLTR